MRYSLNNRVEAKVSIPAQPTQVTMQVELPDEHIPPGVEDTLKKFGWWPEYDSGMDCTMFKRLSHDGPYANGYYHWYEVVALESINLLTLGMARDEANKRAHGHDSMAAHQAL